MRCDGDGARLPVQAMEFFAGGSDGSPIDAHSIQPYYAALVAREAGMGVTIEMDGPAVSIVASQIS
jgi:histidine phosphotransferase ChpT